MPFHSQLLHQVLDASRAATCPSEVKLEAKVPDGQRNPPGAAPETAERRRRGPQMKAEGDGSQAREAGRKLKANQAKSYIEVWPSTLRPESLEACSVRAVGSRMAMRRLRFSMTPSRWNSLITLETASRVEAIMFAKSWWVRRTSIRVPLPFSLPKRSLRLPSSVASRVETSRWSRLSITSSDCRSLSEKEEKSFKANSGSRLMTASSELFWTLATLDSVTASAKTFCQRPSTRFSFPKMPPSLRSAVVASLKSP